MSLAERIDLLVLGIAAGLGAAAVLVVLVAVQVGSKRDR